MREWLEETLAFHSGRTKEQVSNDIERDKILTAKSALDYGLIDQVLESRKVPRAQLSQADRAKTSGRPRGCGLHSAG